MKMSSHLAAIVCEIISIYQVAVFKAIILCMIISLYLYLGLEKICLDIHSRIRVGNIFQFVPLTHKHCYNVHLSL